MNFENIPLQEEPTTIAQTDEIIPAPLTPDTPTECPCCQNTIGSFFGTLQESVSIVWRFHLKTRKHSVHVDLDEFYTKAIDIVDSIIEQYQGINGIVEEPFTNCIQSEGMTEVDYLNSLKSYVECNRMIVGDHSEINSTIDEFLSLIDITLCKLTNYNESHIKKFDAFCYEMLNECGCKSCDCENCECDDEPGCDDCEEE